jgi:hypothetical protein
MYVVLNETWGLVSHTATILYSYLILTRPSRLQKSCASNDTDRLLMRWDLSLVRIVSYNASLFEAQFPLWGEDNNRAMKQSNSSLKQCVCIWSL